MGNKTKQTGKTEVYPFWYMEDIKNMIDYFKMKEIWHRAVKIGLSIKLLAWQKIVWYNKKRIFIEKEKVNYVR